MRRIEILKINEFQTIDVRPELISENGQLLAFSDVLQKDYFQVSYRNGKVALQARGYIGLIPINEYLTLDVRPKVPLANLERILLLSGYSPVHLSRTDRTYSEHEYASSPIGIFLENSFLKYAEEIHERGLLKRYERRRETGFFPKGKIHFGHTARARSKAGTSLVAYEWQERHPDNIQNRIIKFLLQNIFESSRISNNKARKRNIAVCLSYFDQIKLVTPFEIFQEIQNMDAIHIPESKEHYRKTLHLARLILLNKGLGFSSTNRNLILDSLILNLATAFEIYVRVTLEDLAKRDDTISVFDGNKGGRRGKKPLLDKSSLANFLGEEVPATPDILIYHDIPGERSVNLVVEVKYKSVKNIVERDDLNQVVSYMASYGSIHSLLVLPSSSKENLGLRCLGQIDNKGVFQYFIDLKSPDIKNEEEKLKDAVIYLLTLSL